MQIYSSKFGFILILALFCQSNANRCSSPERLQNGIVVSRRAVVRFRCNYQYLLRGESTLPCDSNGRVIGDRPVCARAGCLKPASIENGTVQMVSNLKVAINCNDGFVTAGNEYAFCDGRNWDRTIGNCRPSNHAHNHFCDFETNDMCGWTIDSSWQRKATVKRFRSFSTGPRHDHTFLNAYNGHYILIESSNHMLGDHHLLSPIYPRELSLKTACCFRFHYFMYGAGVGSLAVSVKRQSMPLEIMWNTERNNSQKFLISSNQGNQWLQHIIQIDEMDEDFQVIFTAIEPTDRFGDIAIDDVQLLTGSDCPHYNILTTTTTELVPTDNELVIYDVMNCTNRCGEISPNEDYKRPDGKWIRSCGCDENCLQNENCCFDYIATCLDTTTVEEETSTMPATTTPTPTTTTPSTTTTTKTTTTTPTTTTSTTKKPETPKPSTTTSTTTTTTTTSTTTTTTTTTTRKPIPNPTTTQKASITTQSVILPTTQRVTKDVPSRISWHRNASEINGTDKDNAASTPANILWYFMLSIIIVIIVVGIAYRWKSCSSSSMARRAKVKAVTFKKAMGNGLTRARSKGANNGDSEILCDNDYVTTDDGVLHFEEMGVDKRNATEL